MFVVFFNKAFSVVVTALFRHSLFLFSVSYRNLSDLYWCGPLHRTPQSHWVSCTTIKHNSQLFQTGPRKLLPHHLLPSELTQLYFSRSIIAYGCLLFSASGKLYIFKTSSRRLQDVSNCIPKARELLSVLSGKMVFWLSACNQCYLAAHQRDGFSQCSHGESFALTADHQCTLKAPTWKAHTTKIGTISLDFTTYFDEQIEQTVS